MFKKTRIIYSVIFALSCMSVTAQKLIKKAELQSSNGDFSLAIDSYKNFLRDNPTNYSIMGKMADTYALAGKFEDAIKIYESIPSHASVDPLIYKNHGDVLKQLGMFKEAKIKYENYRMYNPKDADHSIAGCDFAMKALSAKPSYETFVMPSNSSASDFGLTFYKDAPVFSSFRNDILMTEVEREINIESNAHKTFLYNQKKNRLGFIRGMDGSLNNIGPISFSANGVSCAIIQSKITDSHNFITNSKASSLYIANVNDRGEITSSKPFLYNEVGSSINAAHMAFDGTALYFSSNRKGGYGGYDIYVSYLDNGMWSLPKNLGPEINTNGDEITPFLKGNTLYFASNQHIGLGGFDIVKSEVINGMWTEPKNLGLGVNSINDDYFPTLNSMGELYLTSNRLGGKGGNDVYKTLKLKTEETITPEYSNIPKAVSLDELAMETQKHTGNPDLANVVAYKDAEIKIVSNENGIENKKAFSLPEFDVKKVGTNVNEDMSVNGAHRIGLDEVIPTTEVFFIQLASVSLAKPNFARFKPLVRFGNVYKMNATNSVKVRLGYFMDRKEAELALTKVRANGFKDAFITFEILNTAVMELILSSTDDENFTDEGNLNSKNPTEEMRNFKLGSKYKVRLASYEDPIWFDTNKVKDLGRIEQWTKGGWTIFILAGYNNIEEAKKASIQANNRGFKTAEVVIDNGGILERLKQN